MTVRVLKQSCSCGKIWQRCISQIMAKTIRSLKIPFFVIAYSQKSLFSVDDDQGISTLPIFTDAEAAEKYRRYFARKFNLKLLVCVTDTVEKGLNMIECAAMACKSLEYAVIDPHPPSSKLQQPQPKPIQSIIAYLLGRYHRSRTVRNRPSPHKK